MAFTKKDIKKIVERYDIKDFSLVPRAAELILMVDNSEDYSGSYGELFVKNGTLYETGCSHCSCYGCEGQWSPEETLLSAIARRPDGFMGVPMREVRQKARAAGYAGE
jgi:hypothetical protein